jgi:hypothetical protein
VEREALTWQPDARLAALVIPLGELFASTDRDT